MRRVLPVPLVKANRVALDAMGLHHGSDFLEHEMEIEWVHLCDVNASLTWDPDDLILSQVARVQLYNLTRKDHVCRLNVLLSALRTNMLFGGSVIWRVGVGWRCYFCGRHFVKDVDYSIEPFL